MNLAMEPRHEPVSMPALVELRSVHWSWRLLNRLAYRQRYYNGEINFKFNANKPNEGTLNDANL